MSCGLAGKWGRVNGSTVKALQAGGPESRCPESIQMPSGQSDLPGKVRLDFPDKLARKTGYTGEIWSRPEDSTTKNKYKSNQGRFPLSTSASTYTCLHMLIHPQLGNTHTLVNTQCPHTYEKKKRKKYMWKVDWGAVRRETYWVTAGRLLQKSPLRKGWRRRSMCAQQLLRSQN